MNLINISKLETIEDIYLLVKNDLSKIKNELKTSSDEIYILFNDIELGIINLPTLTMLTCVLGSIRKKYEYPFIGYLESHQKEMFYVDTQKASFLKAAKFIDLTQKLRIIDWHLERTIPDLDFNPNTGIILIDVPFISNTLRHYYNEYEYFNKNVFLLDLIKRKNKNTKDVELIYDKVKRDIKNEIKEFIFNDVSKVFTDKEGKSLKNNVISYASELILNSFIHGRVNPYLAIQRTAKLISVTVSDDGIGLIESFKKLHRKTLSNKEALINACKHRINDSYGIYDVLVSVLGIDKPTFVMSDCHHGIATISDDSHILKITRNNFKTLIKTPKEIKTFNTKQRIRGVSVSLNILIK